MLFSISSFPASPRRVVREESLVLAPQMLKIQTFTVWIAWRPGYFVTIAPTTIVTFITALSDNMLLGLELRESRALCGHKGGSEAHFAHKPRMISIAKRLNPELRNPNSDISAILQCIHPSHLNHCCRLFQFHLLAFWLHPNDSN